MMVHVCLVSAQATPNLAPLRDAQLKPNAVILLASEDMQQQAIWLQQAMQLSGVRATVKPVRDPWNPAWLRNDLEAALDGVAQQALMLNATGGTKPMSIALTQWFSERGLPVFYVRPDVGSIIWLSANVSAPPAMGYGLKLPQFLCAYGVQSKPPQRQTVDAVLHQLTCTIIAQGAAWFPAMRQLNALAFQAMNGLQARLEHKPSQPLHALLALLEQHQYIQRHDRTVRFTDESARAWLNGGWLETHVMAEIQALHCANTAIHDVAQGLEVSYGDVRNELDVALLCRNQLYVIECKTRQSKENKPEQVYKLDSIAGRIGGVRASGMLISYQQLPAATEQRAKDMGIRHCSGTDLAHLQRSVSQWLRLS